MSDRDLPWPAGVPCWADVGVPDVETAKEFYAAVLGWEWEPPVVTYGESGYWNALVRERRVAGLSELMGEQPPAWMLYLATDDAAATAEAITGAGGAVVVPPMGVMDLGAMTIAADPTGAAFGTWQAGTHLGARVVNEPGALVWEDLRSTEPVAAQGFYRSVFGFEVDPLFGEYALFRRPDEQFPLGGMGPMFDAVGGSRWVVYFAVADVDATVATAEAHGGSVLTAPHDSDYGRTAVLADRGGAAFAVIAPKPDQPQPQR